MFGHNDDEHNNDDHSNTIDPTTNDDTAQDQGSDDTPVVDTSVPPFEGDNPVSAPVSDTNDDASNDDDSTSEDAAPVVEETPSTPVVDTPISSGANDELLALKREALEDLAPLVNQLDQSPEEKFKTTMMMIQATDDSNLVKDAYQAAKNIPDEKVRAQALLDIVNEINYFTQQHN